MLPDFQGDFVWKSDDVAELLISVLNNYYIGTMLFMDEIRGHAPFKTRLVAGVPEKIIPRDDAIVKILLDGQQRCSSIYYALNQPSIPLYGKKSPSQFACDIEACLKQDWEKGVVVAHSKREIEQISGDPRYINFADFANPGKITQRIFESKYKNQLVEITNTINNFNVFKLQMAELPRGTALERVVDIFERINRTGLPLNITDLLVARLFKHDIELRKLIEEAADMYDFMDPDNNIDPEFIVRTICLIRNMEIRKQTILQLSPENFRRDWDAACYYLEEAFTRITAISVSGYGAVGFRKFVPFKTMIIPMAAMLAFLDANKLSNSVNLAKLDEWYWASVFMNRYNEAVNTNTFADVENFKTWVIENKVPVFIENFSSSSVDFLVSAKTSSVYRRVLCLIIKKGAKDFKTGNDPGIESDKIQDDHIFPKSIYRDDYVLNRTVISTNAEKSNQRPEAYFNALEALNGRDKTLEILATHLIDSSCFDALKAGRLAEFKDSREKVIRAEIERLTPNARHGKTFEALAS